MIKESFERKNLNWSVINKPKDVTPLLLSYIQVKYANTSGIVYCNSKKECDIITLGLQVRVITTFDSFEVSGVKCRAYHSDISVDDRDIIQKMWLSNEVQVIVATIAFGMGIDKANVRFVIHSSFPGSLERLYQEGGRAGRDEGSADCILLYKKEDRNTVNQKSLLYLILA